MTEDEGILAILETPISWEEIRKTSQLPEIEESFLDEIESDDGEIQEYKPRDYRERSFEDKICRVLDIENDLMYERQKKVSNGVIDLFIYDNPPWIIEIKRTGTPFYLYQAIAQLKFYEMCFSRKCKLLISVPGGIPEKFLPILKEFSIKEFKVDANIAYWERQGRL